MGRVEYNEGEEKGEGKEEPESVGRGSEMMRGEKTILMRMIGQGDKGGWLIGGASCYKGLEYRIFTRKLGYRVMVCTTLLTHGFSTLKLPLSTHSLPSLGGESAFSFRLSSRR